MGLLDASAGRRAAAVALALALAAAACGHDRLTVRVVEQPGVARAYSVSCDDQRELCEAEVKRLCPRGARTLDGGRAGWFLEEGKAPQPKAFPGGHFELREWVVSCD